NPFSDSEEEQPDGCSSFAILPEASGDGHTYAGQNRDWLAQTGETVVLLRITQPGKPTIVMQTEAGQIGRHGANSAGIALNPNAPSAARAAIGDALRDHFGFPNSLCKHDDQRLGTGDRYHTVASSIVDLTAGEYWISAGPPCENDYRLVPWNLYQVEGAHVEGASPPQTPAVTAAR